VINVSIGDDGNIHYECSECTHYQIIPIEWANSPFWDMYNGEAILSMLGHLREGTHDVRVTGDRL
jgi:hypothetical protein